MAEVVDTHDRPNASSRAIQGTPQSFAHGSSARVIGMATSLTKQVELVEHRCGMRATGPLLALPISGASVFRWRSLTDDLFQVSANVPPDSVIASIVLQPMWARFHGADREIWSGPVNAGSLRLIHFSLEAPLRFHCSHPFDLLHVHLPLDGVRAVARRFGLDFIGTIAESVPLYLSDELAGVLGKHLADVMEMPIREGRLYADGIVQALAAHLILHYQHTAGPHPPDTSDPLQRAFDHVTQAVDARIEVAQLAELAGMSKHHFSRQFRLRFGISPHAHVIASRLAQAKTRLAHTDQSILQIAMDCGFADASHFGRAFRYAEGMTPTHYRLLHSSS